MAYDAVGDGAIGRRNKELPDPSVKEEWFCEAAERFALEGVDRLTLLGLAAFRC